MKDYIQVFTTTENKDDAREIARDLVENRLVACAQVVGPYRWKGKIEEEEEWLCILKSRYESYEKLEDRIKSIHPYEEPEILALPVVKGSRGYLEWIDRQMKADPENEGA